jgi:hypothetical protein
VNLTYYKNNFYGDKKMIEKSFDELMREAPGTARYFLVSAIAEIDSVFEDGYAKEHPDLLAAFLNGSIKDFATGATLKVLEEKIGELVYSVDSIADAMNS